MNQILRRSFSVGLTLLAVIAALLVLRHLWQYYMYDPWTRDAHVAADVIQVAPDVSGLVAEVRVHDNDRVHRGDVLFVVDQARYRIALEQAEGSLQRSQAAQERSQAALERNQATLERNQATLEQLQREASRDSRLRDLLATEEIEARRARVTEAKAGIAEAKAGVTDAKAGINEAKAAIASASAALDKAKLDLERTLVLSPVDGRVNDSLVRIGDYVSAGKAAFAIVDTASIRVDGYFEETRLPGIHVGDPVEIYLMGEKGVLHGHVDSIAAGIQDRYRSSGANLLPNVTPAFDWVRLAQRIPVRVRFDDLPKGIHLIAGRTATVKIAATRKRDHQAPAEAKADRS